MNAENVVGILAGILTAASLLPQLVKILKSKQVDDVSWGMLGVLMAGLATWVAYGIIRQDLPIIITNSFSLAINSLIIIFKFKYSKA